jgi:MoaA/NifB/PqqE/SkfB family radical SAM enzyme
VTAAVAPVEASSRPWVGPDGQLMRRLELHITYTCPERCVFCSEDHRMARFHAFPVTLGRVTRVLREHAARGVEAVHLTGGEPTIHPHFVEILALAKRLGLRTSMGTIGTRLANPEFAAAVMPWMDDILFSLHGPDEASHDALTRTPGSFRKLLRAIGNSRRHAGFRPSFNTVVTVENLGRLPELGRLIHDLGGGLWILSNLTPEGAGEDRYDGLTVRLGDIARIAPALVAAAPDTIVRFFGTPACVLPPALRMYSNDLHWNPRVTVEWAAEPGRVFLDGIYSWTPERKRRHGAACAACTWNTLCPGAFGAYLDRFGDAELSALEAG